MMRSAGLRRDFFLPLFTKYSSLTWKLAQVKLYSAENSQGQDSYTPVQCYQEQKLMRGRMDP